MDIISVKNCFWVNEDKSIFNCTVQFSTFAYEVEFGCAVFDPTPHAQEIWQRAMAGEFGPITEFVPPPPPIEVTSTPSSGEIPQSVL
jgi:hypothetical protein